MEYGVEVECAVYRSLGASMQLINPLVQIILFDNETNDRTPVDEPNENDDALIRLI